MYCIKCGKEVTEQQHFCKWCGEPVHKPDGDSMQIDDPQADTSAPNDTTDTTQKIDYSSVSVKQESKPSPTASKKKTKTGNRKKSTPLIITLAVAALVIIAVGGFFVLRTINNNRKLNEQYDALIKSIHDYEIPSDNEKSERLEHLWDQASSWDLSEKEEFIKDLTDLEAESSSAAETLAVYEQTLSDLKADMEKYHLTDGYDTYETAIQNFSEAVQAKDVNRAETAKQNVESAFIDLINQNQSYINDRIAAYQSLNLSNAEAADIQTYNDNYKKLQSLINGDDYSAFKPLFTELDEIYLKYVDPEKALNVTVQQVDITDYPTVKLYANIEDSSTGQVPSDLEQLLFYIRKEDANGDYIRQTVTQVRQLNGQEALTVDIVADVSGSMNGSPLQEAKSVMNSFIRSVQFNSGDMVELTAFSTGVYMVEPFCNDADKLISEINALTTDDMTSLYDALCTAVTRVAAQPGARCVIAFTDGLDNYSNSTAQDVIDLAKRYSVPVFIIGIGNNLDYSVSSIASETGGCYYNVRDISSMNDIYTQIYRQEKELYLIEFEDNTNTSFSDESNILAGYHSPEYGGEVVYHYTPAVLLSVDDSTIYISGPEATVAGYLKNFAPAITEKNFSYISPYLKVNSNIYTMQEKYVRTVGVAETLDSYEIEDVTYSSSDRCIVTTRETFYVQSPRKPLQLLTQRCKYVLERSNNEWKMTDFADLVEVLLQINT